MGEGQDMSEPKENEENPIEAPAAEAPAAEEPAAEESAAEEPATEESAAEEPAAAEPAADESAAEAPATEESAAEESAAEAPAAEAPAAAEPAAEESAAEAPAAEESAAAEPAAEAPAAEEPAAEEPAAEAPVAAEPAAEESATAEPSAAPTEEPTTPSAQPLSALPPGSVVKGKVSRTTRRHVYLDLPEGAEGLLELREVEEFDGAEAAAEGTELDVYVLGPIEASGQLRLSRIMTRGGRSPEDLPRCFKENIPVEGKVTAARKGGFDVFISGQRAFLPASQADLNPVAEKDALVGLIGRFRIIEFNPRRNNMVVSRRKVLEREARALKADLAGAIEPGQEFDGKVKQIKEYGVFVDIGGTEGLVHVTELSWNRVDHPQDVVAIGDKVRVHVLRYSAESGKLSLSIKQLEPNPWARLGTDFLEEGVYSGKVVRLVDFGAFVELAPGLEGLVHNSELSWDSSIRHADELLDPGDTVQVKLITFDRKRRRVSLSIKGTTGDPWVDVADKYPVGAMAEGVVERVAKFGVFVSVGDGVTALIPVSRTGVPREISLLRRFHPGNPIKAMVIEVDAKRRRLTLSLAGSDEDDHREVSSYMKKQKKEEASLGTFGDLLAGFSSDDD